MPSTPSSNNSLLIVFKQPDLRTNQDEGIQIRITSHLCYQENPGHDITFSREREASVSKVEVSEFGNGIVLLQDLVNTIGVEDDFCLRLNRKPSKGGIYSLSEMALLMGMKYLLDSDGLMTPYKVQIRPLIECVSLFGCRVLAAT